MGVHLIVYRKNGEVEEDGQAYWDVEKHPTWDTIRMSGDKDFIMSQYPCSEVYQDTDDKHYWRPSDFNSAKEWVKGNVWEGNQKRLLDILDEMAADLDLYFYNSW